MSKGLKNVWVDCRGRKFLVDKLTQATFQVKTNKDGTVLAYKIDPAKEFYLVLDEGTITFVMELDNDLISNPHRFFHETMSGELNLLQSWAQEFTTLKGEQMLTMFNDFLKYVV